MDQEQQETKDAIARLVRGQSTMVLSTVNGNGEPHAAPLFYLAGEGLELYWFSSDSSRHSCDLTAGQSVSAAIHTGTENWNQICGVQMLGKVETITDRKTRRDITKRYCERFHLGSIFRLALSRSSLYVLRPSWVRYLDNARRFGFKVEIHLPPQ